MIGPNFEREMMEVISNIVQKKIVDFEMAYGQSPHFIVLPENLQKMLISASHSLQNEDGITAEESSLDRVYTILGLQVCPTVKIKSLADITVF